MTFQIAKSTLLALPFDYPNAVEAFRQAKLAHRFTGDIGPAAPAIIENAVRRVPVEGQADDFVLDYEIIDDLPPPPPPPTLDERKAALVATVRAAEAAALATVISPARERLLYLDLAAVYSKPEAERTDADKALHARIADVTARKSAIQRQAVLQEIEIEDLTAATIEGWTPAPFPEAPQALQTARAL